MNKDKLKIIEFEKKQECSVDDMIEWLKENKDDLEGIILLNMWKKGEFTMGWTDREYIAILGLLEIAKQQIMENMRE